jgi:hypothetical protein
MKTDFRFGQVYIFAGLLLSLFALLIALPLLFSYNLHHAEGISSHMVTMPLGWFVATLFGVRARRLWAYQFNQVLLALATAGCLCTFVFTRHPALILSSLLFAACYYLFFRSKHLFPARLRQPAKEALANYPISDNVRRLRRHWYILAILFLLLVIAVTSLGLMSAFLSGDLPSIVSVLLSAVLAISWRFLVIGCAHNAWGTRMAFWETLSSVSLIIAMLCDVGPKALLLFHASYRWAAPAWALGFAFTIAYFITSYRLRQINLTFRTHRESLANAA